MNYPYTQLNLPQKTLSDRGNVRCGSSPSRDGNQSNLTATPLAIEYRYSIHGDVVGIEAYTDLIELLQQATENDVIYLHLNTYGGSLDTAVDIIHRIRSCRATVVGCADGMVASAGSLLFFACTGWEVGEYSQLMLHDGSGGHIGKTNENARSIEALTARISKLYYDIYGQFLPKKKIKSVLGGKDLYLSSEEVVKILEEAVANTDTDD